MNDFFEIENELRKLRPAQPSPVLFERVEDGLNCRASVSDGRSRWWRFTEWSRGDAGDLAGQLAGARERERASQKPYNWFSLGLGLAAAAALVLFAAVTMERHQRGGKEIAQTSRESEPAPLLDRVQEPASSARFIPAGATRVVYNTRNEGLQFAPSSGQPLRRFRYQTHETWQWRNPTTGASLRVSYPSEEVVLIPVSGQ